MVFVMISASQLLTKQTHISKFAYPRCFKREFNCGIDGQDDDITRFKPLTQTKENPNARITRFCKPNYCKMMRRSTSFIKNYSLVPVRFYPEPSMHHPTCTDFCRTRLHSVPLAKSSEHPGTRISPWSPFLGSFHWYTTSYYGKNTGKDEDSEPMTDTDKVIQKKLDQEKLSQMSSTRKPYTYYGDFTSDTNKNMVKDEDKEVTKVTTDAKEDDLESVPTLNTMEESFEDSVGLTKTVKIAKEAEEQDAAEESNERESIVKTSSSSIKSSEQGSAEKKVPAAAVDNYNAGLSAADSAESGSETGSNDSEENDYFDDLKKEKNRVLVKNLGSENEYLSGKVPAQHVAATENYTVQTSGPASALNAVNERNYFIGMTSGDESDDKNKVSAKDMVSEQNVYGNQVPDPFVDNLNAEKSVPTTSGFNLADENNYIFGMASGPDMSDKNKAPVKDPQSEVKYTPPPVHRVQQAGQRPATANYNTQMSGSASGMNTAGQNYYQAPAVHPTVVPNYNTGMTGSSSGWNTDDETNYLVNMASAHDGKDRNKVAGAAPDPKISPLPKSSSLNELQKRLKNQARLKGIDRYKR